MQYAGKTCAQNTATEEAGEEQASRRVRQLLRKQQQETQARVQPREGTRGLKVGRQDSTRNKWT